MIENHDDFPDVIKQDLPVLIGKSPAGSNPVDTYLSGKADHTKRMVKSHMNKIAVLFGYDSYLSAPWGSLRYHHVQELLGQLKNDGYAPKTINAILAAVRGVATAAFNMYQLDGDDLERIRGVKMVRGSRLKSGRIVPAGELSSLIYTCISDEGPAGIRDIAIIGILYICGLRRSEAAALSFRDVNVENREIRLIGKGNKERKVFMDSGTQAALSDWITLRGDWPGTLFCRILKSGKVVQNTSMTDQAIYGVLTKRWKQAGTPALTPHDFRRTFISSLLAKGVDLLTVQRMAGHSDPRTTSGYDLRPEEDMRTAATMLHLPYQSIMNSKN